MAGLSLVKKCYSDTKTYMIQNTKFYQLFYTKKGLKRYRSLQRISYTCNYLYLLNNLVTGIENIVRFSLKQIRMKKVLANFSQKCFNKYYQLFCVAKIIQLFFKLKYIICSGGHEKSGPDQVQKGPPGSAAMIYSTNTILF